MIVRKTNLIEKKFPYSHNKNIFYNSNSKKNRNFQKELFDSLEIQKNQEVFRNEDLEVTFKKLFLGEIIKKDHLYSAHLTEREKDNLIKISQYYY
ncbi:MAG: hypothetical protein ACK4UJ_07625 [Leptonema sp. (in: bacteria)]